MHIILDISKEVYEHILKAKSVPDMLGIDIVNTMNAVKNGTPLPKRLVDADKFLNSLKGIERLYIDDELRSNILNALYDNTIVTEIDMRSDMENGYK